jgi:hypothetical protein
VADGPVQACGAAIGVRRTLERVGERSTGEQNYFPGRGKASGVQRSDSGFRRVEKSKLSERAWKSLSAQVPSNRRAKPPLREGITAAYSDFLADDGQRSRVRLRQDVNNRCLKKYALIESKA